MERTPRAAIGRAILALLVAASVLVPAAPAAAAPEPPAPEPTAAAEQAQGPATPAERTALDEARETGRQVVVPEHTTETREVLANPEGTFTLRTSAAPQRVKRDGGWTPVDTSLRANPDGTLSPAAALVDVAFSGGGTGPVVSLREADGRVSLSWPTALPVPVVDGAKATYPEVFPGVDLVVAASAVGYSYVLVVRDAQAAANPDLLDIVLTAETQGLTLDVGEGVLNARDAKGALVFAGSTPVMWDGSRPDEKAPAPTATDPGGAKVTKVGLTARKAARSESESEAKELRVQPDRAALTGPGVTYPVYIDPGMAGGQQAWAEVTANGYKYWNAAMDAQVGRCYNREGHCGSLTLARSYFRLDSSPLQKRNGYTAVVFSAEMWFTQVWGAHLCVAEPVSLYSSGYFDSGITWSNQPLGTGNLSNAMDTKSSGAGTQCTGPGGVRFDAPGVKNYAQTSANNSWGSVHVALAAPDEGNDYQWKKFATSGTAAPHFDVVFSFPPGPASVHGVSNAVACTGLAITPDARPTLYGTASDNNSPPLNVGLSFEVWDSNGVALKASGSTSGASGVRQGWTPSNALPDGDYAYRIAVHNVFPGDGTKNLSNGTWSPWYWFRVKATAPATAPRIVSSVDYPANYWGAPKGELGAIAVDSAGATGVVGYTYTFGGSGTEPVPNTSTCDYTPGGSSANGNFAPASASGPTWLPITNGLSTGYHTLHVRGFDHAHNLSPESTAHVFYVAPNTGQAATRYEAENLAGSQPAGQAKPLGPEDQCCHLTWSGGKQLALSADAPGQSFTVAFQVAAEADYQVSVGMTKARDYGQVAFSLDGQAIGRPDPAAAVGPIDGYNPDAINALTTLGIRRLTAGTHQLKVTVTGTHPNSAGVRYKAGIDHITITHTTRYEAELPAQVTPSQPADQGVPITVEQQGTGNGPFSEGAHLLFGATAQGKSFDLAFTVPHEADYALGIALSKRANRGKLRIAVDGVPLRRTDTEPWDGYQGTGGQAAYLPLGGAHLKAGQHRLTITVVGKNDGSSGYTAGVDYLNAVAINGVTAASFTDAMNNRGFGTDGVTAASLDFNGQSLSSAALASAGLQPGTKVTHGRATFTIPTANPATGNDNVVAMGQTIPLPAEHRVKATAIGLLAVSTCGDTQPTTATVTYTDGTTSNPVVPGVPDWIYNSYPSESDAVRLSHRLEGTTPNPTKAPRLYAVFAPTDPTKTLASIMLPNTGTAFQPNTCGPAAALHVLSMAPAPVATGWLGAWSEIVDDPRDLSDPAGKTVRMVVRPSKQGTAMRLKLSNTDSDVPSSVLRVTVGAQSGNSAATLAAPVAVTFGGALGVTMPARGDVYSDELPFPATAGGSGNLLVSIALPPSAPEVPFSYGTSVMWFAASGQVTGNADGTAFAGSGPLPGTYLLTGVEVKPAGADQGTVAVISDREFGSDSGERYPELSKGWTDFLVDRMGAQLPGSLVSTGQAYSRDAVAAPHRYALGQPNVRTVVINMNTLWDDETVDDIRRDLTDLMGVANANGLRNHRRSDGSPLSVIITTIPPTGMEPTDPEEVLRKQVNDMIRTSYIDLGADQMIDFDAAVRDPNAPHMAQSHLVHPDGGWPLESYDQRLAQAVVDAVDGFPPLTF